MKKIFLFVLLLSFISIIIIVYQSIVNNNYSDVNISKVSISEGVGFDKVNYNFFKMYKDKKTLHTFKEVISNTKRISGLVDVGLPPNFNLEIIYKDGNRQEYYLWLGEKGEKSSLINVDDTHTIYSVSEDMTNKLIDLIK